MSEMYTHTRPSPTGLHVAAIVCGVDLLVVSTPDHQSASAVARCLRRVWTAWWVAVELGEA